MKVWERAVKRAPLSALTEYTHPRGEVLSLVCCALHAYPVWVVLLSQTVCDSAVQVRSSLRKNKEQKKSLPPRPMSRFHGEPAVEPVHPFGNVKAASGDLSETDQTTASSCIGWGLGLGQLPDFYHFSAITGSCQLLPF